MKQGVKLELAITWILPTVHGFTKHGDGLSVTAALQLFMILNQSCWLKSRRRNRAVACLSWSMYQVRWASVWASVSLA